MILLILAEREASPNRRTFTVGAQKFETSAIISCLISSYLWHSNRTNFDVITNVVVKKVHCTWIHVQGKHLFHFILPSFYLGVNTEMEEFAPTDPFWKE